MKKELLLVALVTTSVVANAEKCNKKVEVKIKDKIEIQDEKRMKKIEIYEDKHNANICFDVK